MHRKNSAVLGLGSNIGAKASNLCGALKIISGFCDIVSVSSVYKTKSLLKDSQDDYLNLCVLINTDLNQQELLNAVKHAEKVLGRKEAGRWSARIIDIDIIDYGFSGFSADNLSVPHPEMHNRSFVLMPLKEILPGYVHPLNCLSVDDMLNLVIDNLGIKKLGVCTWLL